MTDTPTLRLDVWLWRTRFFKTRALSGTYIRKRGVRLTRNGQTRRVKEDSADRSRLGKTANQVDQRLIDK